MASKCPRCRSVLEDEAICCAEYRHSWKCASCGKLTKGFVVPYGRCYLCGGQLEIVEAYRSDAPEQARVIEEALQFEVDMYSFYRLAKDRTTSQPLRELLEDLFLKEKEHIAELEEKYHAHLDPELLEPPAGSQDVLSSWIFEGIDFDDAEAHVLGVFDRALEMERRTRDYFKAKAESLPPGKQRELYRELAAEEEDHVTTLETERDLQK